MHSLQERVYQYLMSRWTDGHLTAIDNFEVVLGGYSKDTFKFDALFDKDGESFRSPLILRRDTPKSTAILHNSRAREHALLNRLREHTKIKVPRSYFAELDPGQFDRPAMIIERIIGCTEPTSLFKSAATAAQAESIARQLCEQIAALHTTPPDRLNEGALFSDPKGVGAKVDSWEHYIDSMISYFIKHYDHIDFDALPVLYDSYLHLRRNKPRSLPLSLVHGELNPSNLVFQDGDLLAVVDWENAHIGDPREDLGWFRFMDATSGTNFFNSISYPGGFLGYYNHLTGYDITPEELNYFQIFGFNNVADQAIAAIKRRITGQHQELLHLYLLRIVIGGTLAFTQLLGYPSPAPAPANSPA